MSATLTNMRDFIMALQAELPAELHPCAASAIHWYFAEMRDKFENPAEVVRLAAKVRATLEQERIFDAENEATVRDMLERSYG